jgi:hypothetical protein
MKRVTKKNGRGRKTKPRQPRKRAGFLKEKTIEELAAEQGVTLPQRIEDLIGAGKDLWDSDAEFEEFLKGIYERRRRGR